MFYLTPQRNKKEAYGYINPGPVPTTTAREAPSNKLRKTMAALARDVSEERRGEEGLGAGEKRKRCVIEDDNEVDDDGEEANGDDDEEESETQ